MEAAEGDGRKRAAEVYDGRQCRVLRRTGGAYQGYHSRRKPYRRRYAYRGRQELIVYVAGLGRAGWHYYRRCAISCIPQEYEEARQQARDIVCGVGELPPARRSSCSVGDAQVSSRIGICHVFEPAAGNAAAQSDRH
jgi:hypothetical protein